MPAGRALHVYEGEGLPIFSVAFSPDGRWLAAGSGGGGLRLWELETGQVRALAGHQAGLRSVTFSPDGRHLLSTDAGGLIVQWNARTGEREFDLRHRHGDNPAAVDGGTKDSELSKGTIAGYAPNGRTIVSVGVDEWVMIWDTATRVFRDQVRIGTNILAFSISPDIASSPWGPIGRDRGLRHRATS